MDRSIEIRKATRVDLDALRSFEQELIKYERPLAPQLKKDPIHYYDMENLINREDSSVMVVVVGHELVGCGYAQIRSSKVYETPDQFAYLGFMYIAPDFRGMGINGKLINSLIEWSKNRGMSELQLDVYPNNLSAINSYKKKGFRPSQLKMSLIIDPDDN